jgi:hypothetical protein
MGWAGGTLAMMVAADTLPSLKSCVGLGEGVGERVQRARKRHSEEELCRAGKSARLV